jgi:hypothetical protein
MRLKTCGSSYDAYAAVNARNIQLSILFYIALFLFMINQMVGFFRRKPN